MPRNRFKSVDDLNPKVRAQAARALGKANLGCAPGDVEKIVRKAKRQKCNAQRTEGPKPMGTGTVPYDSKKEAAHAHKLEAMRRSGEIRYWLRQVKIDIPPKPGEAHGAYVCDFMLVGPGDRIRYEDVKGRRSGPIYKEFQRKARVVLEVYGIKIEEI